MIYRAFACEFGQPHWVGATLPEIGDHFRCPGVEIPISRTGAAEIEKLRERDDVLKGDWVGGGVV